MKIGINLTPYTGNGVGGLGVYLQSLVYYLSKIPSKNKTFLIFGNSKKIKELKKNYSSQKIQYIVVEEIPNTRELSTKLKKLISEYHIDVWFCPFLILDPIDCPVPSAVLIPDMQHEYYPEFFSEESIKWRKIKYQESAVLADKIFTLSENSKKDIVKFLKIDEKKIIVTYLDSPPWINNKLDHHIEKNLLRRHKLKTKEYIFYPANTWPHKNHIKLVEAFFLLLNKYPNMKLVFSGNSEENMKVVKKRIERLKISKNVVFLDYIKNIEVPYIYKNSICLVFPSLFEGFGIPLIEAMRTKCPIVCSNSTSIPEIVKNAGLYFNPNISHDIYQKIRILISDKNLQQNLISNANRRVKFFSYTKTAEKTYRELLLLGKKRKTITWPKISIITPSYNQGQFIERTIKSVLDQKYPNLEYIVMDGGSTDNTLDILKKYENKITKWISKKDKGQTDAINKGFKISSGKIFAYLNSDDTYESGILFFVAKIFLENKNINFLYGMGKHIDENDKVIEDYHNGLMDFSKPQSSCDICQPATFWRKEVYEKIGNFNLKTDLAMDYEYWIRVSKKFDLIYLEKYLANSRLHKNTKTLSMSTKVMREVMKIQLYNYGRIHEDWIFGLLIKQLNVNNFEEVRLRQYPLLIIKSFFLICFINKRLPSKKTFRLYLYIIKKIIRYFQINIFWNIIGKERIKKYIELGIFKQHSPKKPYEETFPNKKVNQFLKISIVTPSYNQGGFIEDTIKSVIDQNYPNIEYFVQDNVSIDQTNHILNKYKDKIILESKKDRGQSNAINEGFKKSSGEIMAYLNSDDMLMSGVLQYVNNFFLKHPNVDVIYGHRLIINEKNEQIGRWIGYRYDPRVLKFIDYIPQETMFWRRRIWKKVGGKLNERYKFAMDWELIIRFLKAGAVIKRVPYFLGKFRYHLAQKTTSKMSTIGKLEINKILHNLHKTNIPETDIVRLLLKYRLKAAVISFLFDKGIRI